MAAKISTNRAAIAVGDALVVVDVQNDFLPGGALAVPAGDECRALEEMLQQGAHLIASLTVTG